MHPRKTIRNAIASRIRTPLPDGLFWTPAGERVFSSKPTTINPHELPCVIVRSLEESVEETGVTEFSTYRRRELRVSVDCLAEAYDDVEDVLDDMAYGVELSMEGFVIPTQEEAKIELTKTEIDTSIEGDLPLGAARVLLTVNYMSVYNGVDFGFSAPTQGATAFDLNKDGDTRPEVCTDPFGASNVTVQIHNSYDPDDYPEPAVETILED